MFSWLSPLYLWRHHFTAAGKTLTLATLFCVPGLISLDTPLLQLLSVILPMLVISVAIGLQNRPKIRLTASLPPRATNGREFEVLLTLTNARFRATYNLDLEFEESEDFEILSELPTISCIASKAQYQLRIQARPRRRGAFTLPKLVISSTFPLFVVRTSEQHHLPDEIIVWPDFYPLAQQQTHCLYQDARVAAHLAFHHTDDYIGNRDYQPGDSLRQLDFRSWARLGTPVVRMYRQQEENRLLVILDCRVRHRTESTEQRFESLVSLAAAMLDRFVSDHWEVGMLIWGVAAQPPIRGKVAMFDALARVRVEYLGNQFTHSTAPSREPMIWLTVDPTIDRPISQNLIRQIEMVSEDAQMDTGNRRQIVTPEILAQGQFSL